MKKYELSFPDQTYALMNLSLSTPWISLDRVIDKQVFEEAVNKALHYHPIFKTEIKRENGLYYLEENPLPMKVRDLSWEKGYTFSKEDNNNYPWIIACADHDIIITGSHVITDGSGINQFLQTVVRLYLEMMGVTFHGDFGLVKEELREESTTDPYEKNAVPGMTDPLPKNENAKEKTTLLMPKELYETDISRLKFKQFVLDEEEIRACGKDTETSMFAVLSVILSESLAKTIGAKDGYIRMQVPSDFRFKTGTYTDRCFVQTMRFPYDIARGAKKPLDFMAMGFRSQMDIEADADSIVYKITELDKKKQMLKANPAMLEALREPIMKKTFSTEAKVTYTHVIRHGFDAELLKYIRMYQIIPAKPTSLEASTYRLNAAVTSNFNGKVYLNLVHKIKDGLWESNMENVLRKYGLHYELNDYRPAPYIIYQI